MAHPFSMLAFVPIFSATHSARFEALQHLEEHRMRHDEDQADGETSSRRATATRTRKRAKTVVAPPPGAVTVAQDQHVTPPASRAHDSAQNGVTNSLSPPALIVDDPDAVNLAQELPKSAWQKAKMAPRTHWWISLWFLVTVPVIFWDVGYCFMRPRSMKGGDLHWIWKPYAIYQEIDYVYGLHALENNDGFTNAQSLLNVVETLLNILYVYLAHVTLTPSASLVGFASATMTLSKTVLYWAQEYYCGGCAVGHNNLVDLTVYWIIPNGLWLLVPSMIIRTLYKDLASALRVADKVSSGKTQ